MKALLLAAGYATRLRPLTDRIAKPLLPVGGRPMADWILDRIAESGAIDGVEVVTNALYAPAFAEWAASARRHGLRRRHRRPTTTGSAPSATSASCSSGPTPAARGCS